MKQTLSIFLFLTTVFCRAQQTTIHFDKPYYFAGEFIFYSFCNTGLPNDSVSVEVELISKSEVIESYFLPLQNQCGDGYFKLAYDTPSATYQINISIYQQHNFIKKNICHAPIVIYNDGDLANLRKLSKEPEKPWVSNSYPTNDVTTSVRDENILIIELPKDVTSKIKRISVSVRDQDLFGSHQNTIYQELPDQSWEDPIGGIPFGGTRELLVENNIRNHLLFTLNLEDMIFNGTGVDLTTKSFNVEVSPFYGKKQISFLDYLGNKINITARADEFIPSQLEQLTVDSSILRHIQIYREEKQINRIFKQVGIQINPDSSSVLTNKIPAKFFIDVQDYDIRGTMVTLFKELSTSLKFRNIGKGNYEAKLLYERNGLTKFYSRPPLFIVNNSATYDGVFIAKIPLQEIKYISIFNDYDSLQKLSPIALGGLVYLEMLDPNYALPKELTLPTLSLQGMQTPIALPVKPDIKPEVPALGSLLFWHPNLKMLDSTINVDIQGVDITSRYLVEVVLHLQGGQIKTIRKFVDVGS